MELGQEMGAVAAGRMRARVISVNGAWKVEVPVLKVSFVEEAFEVGQARAVGALASTIGLGVLGRGAGFVEAPEAEEVTEDRGFEVRPLVRVDLNGGPKMRSQNFSKARRVVSAFMSGRGTATTNLVKRSSITKMTRLPRAVAGSAVWPPTKSRATMSFFSQAQKGFRGSCARREAV
ncbi:MAG: hypothetical protein FD187_3206 [bacterium]|nr:MAG: hypothetical protein FD187_3206 [bacterium]